MEATEACEQQYHKAHRTTRSSEPGGHQDHKVNDKYSDSGCEQIIGDTG